MDSWPHQSWWQNSNWLWWRLSLPSHVEFWTDFFCQVIKEELQYHLLIQSVLLAVQSWVSLPDVSTPLGTGASVQRALSGECPALGFGDAALRGWDCLLFNRCYVWKTLFGFKFLVCCFLRTCNWDPAITEINNNNHFDFTEAVSKTSFRKLEGWENGWVPWSKVY